MVRKIALLTALVTAFVTALTLSPASTAAPPTGSVTPMPVPMTGTTTGGGTFVGTLDDIRFVNQRGNLAVTGLLTGQLTDGGQTQNVSQQVTLPVTAASNTSSGVVAQQIGSCEILDLTLGPLDLDLLGLVVHLDEVHLNITAERGPGNLLGNLLCGVAGLLDNGGGGGLANLLNQLLGLLGL